MKTKRERLTHGYGGVQLATSTMASARADAEFIAQFGKPAFDKHIAPRHKAGVMSIFDRKPNLHTMCWIALVTAYVNEPLNPTRSPA